MIGQYLSNKNKSTIVAKSKNFSELNKAEFFLPRVLSKGVDCLTGQLFAL